MTLRDAATALGVRVKTVRNLLYRHRDQFGPARYVPGPTGAIRVICDDELTRLHGLLLAWRAASRR